MAGGALGQGPTRTHELSCVLGRAGPARSVVAEPMWQTVKDRRGFYIKETLSQAAGHPGYSAWGLDKHVSRAHLA